MKWANEFARNYREDLYDCIYKDPLNPYRGTLLVVEFLTASYYEIMKRRHKSETDSGKSWIQATESVVKKIRESSMASPRALNVMIARATNKVWSSVCQVGSTAALSLSSHVLERMEYEWPNELPEGDGMMDCISDALESALSIIYYKLKHDGFSDLLVYNLDFLAKNMKILPDFMIQFSEECLRSDFQAKQNYDKRVSKVLGNVTEEQIRKHIDKMGSRELEEGVEGEAEELFT